MESGCQEAVSNAIAFLLTPNLSYVIAITDLNFSLGVGILAPVKNVKGAPFIPSHCQRVARVMSTYSLVPEGIPSR